MKALKITIAVLGVLALLLAVFVFWPSNGGELTASLSDSRLKNDGLEAWVQGEVKNENNKPAFNVEWTIEVQDENGNLIGTITETSFMLFPGQTVKFEKYIPLNDVAGTADFYVSVHGSVMR